MKSRNLVFFDVIGDCKKCRKSLFITDENYKVGEHFIHHFYKVECVVTKIEAKNF